MGLTQQWTLWCSYCTCWEQESGRKSDCLKIFKKNGWKIIDKQWICPDCLKSKENFTVETKGNGHPKKS